LSKSSLDQLDLQLGNREQFASVHPHHPHHRRHRLALQVLVLVVLLAEL
jgi:hypothetical protein